jgi:hypothetical protein
MENILGENRSMGWIALPAGAPAFVKQFVTEFRRARLEKRELRSDFLRQHTKAAEQRGLTVRRTAVIPRRAPIFINEDAELRARAAKIQDRIRQDAITDRSCKAVKLVGGRFVRDYAREAEIRAVEEAAAEKRRRAYKTEHPEWVERPSWWSN